VIDVKLVSVNASGLIDCVEAGMQIDFSEEHRESEFGPISRSRDPDPNSITAREEHEEKHRSCKISTDAGMQIEFSEVHCSKTPFSISRSSVSRWNGNDDNDLQCEKHPLRITATAWGRVISWSAEQCENARSNRKLRSEAFRTH
jgi:hypothetical protein